MFYCTFPTKRQFRSAVFASLFSKSDWGLGQRPINNIPTNYNFLLFHKRRSAFLFRISNAYSLSALSRINPTPSERRGGRVFTLCPSEPIKCMYPLFKSSLARFILSESESSTRLNAFLFELMGKS